MALASQDIAPKQRGVFVLFEGVDRSGKTTQARLLANRMEKEGISTARIAFPDRNSAIGTVLNAHLRGTVPLPPRAAHLLFSANRWETVGEIVDLLISGTSIVMDRYAFSGLAYSVAKGLPSDWCQSTEVGLPAPDLVILLDADAATQTARGEWGAEINDNDMVQKLAREAFLTLSDPDNWVHPSCPGGTPEELAEFIWTLHVEPLVKRMAECPWDLKTLA